MESNTHTHTPNEMMAVLGVQMCLSLVAPYLSRWRDPADYCGSISTAPLSTYNCRNECWPSTIRGHYAVQAQRGRGGDGLLEIKTNTAALAMHNSMGRIGIRCANGNRPFRSASGCVDRGARKNRAQLTGTPEAGEGEKERENERERQRERVKKWQQKHMLYICFSLAHLCIDFIKIVVHRWLSGGGGQQWGEEPVSNR